jgi:hypothetical protein
MVLKNQSNKFSKSVSLKLSNISKIPDDITLDFGQPTDIFSFNEAEIHIRSQLSQNISLSFISNSTLLYNSTLIIFIKDNPEPLFLNITSEGQIPPLIISSDNIDFGRTLVNFEKAITIDVTNSSQNPSTWIIHDLSKIKNNIHVSAYKGIINQKQVLPITFTDISSVPE